MDDRQTRLALSCALLAALTGVAVQAILLPHAATRAAVRYGGGRFGRDPGRARRHVNKTGTFGGAGKSAVMIRACRRFGWNSVPGWEPIATLAVAS